MIEKDMHLLFQARVAEELLKGVETDIVAKDVNDDTLYELRNAQQSIRILIHELLGEDYQIIYEGEIDADKCNVSRAHDSDTG